MRKIYFLGVSLISAGMVYSQAPTADWVKQMQISATSSAPGESVGKSIVADADGNVYTTGYFSGATQDLDGGTGTVILSSVLTTMGFSTQDVFVTKHTADGTLEWARQMGGQYNDYAIDLALNADGDVYITGYYGGNADFDPGVGEVLAPAYGNQDIFIVKLDADGNFVWLKTIGSGGNDQGNSIAVDTDGNVYLAGNFTGTVDFDPGAGITEFTSAGNEDVYVLKLDGNGNFTWAKQLIGDGNDYTNSLALDTDAHPHITGTFNGGIDLNPAGGTGYGANGPADLFIVELDEDGDYVWGYAAGGDGNESGGAITTDASGSCYVSGIFSSISTPTDFGGTQLTSAGYLDIFVAKYNTSGSLQWVKQISGADNEGTAAIALDANNNVYITGHYNQTVDFNPGTGDNSITASNGADLFVLKLDNSGNYEWVKSYNGGNEQMGRSIFARTENELYVTGHFYLDLTIDGTTIGCPPPPAAICDAFILKMSGSGPVGLFENTAAGELHVFPNPATNQLFIELTESAEVTIFSASGERVIQVLMPAGTNTLETTSLAPGMYYIQTSNGKQTRFVKQ